MSTELATRDTGILTRYGSEQEIQTFMQRAAAIFQIPEEALALAAGLYAGEKAWKKVSGLSSIKWGEIAPLEPSERLCNEPGYLESTNPYLF